MAPVGIVESRENYYDCGENPTQEMCENHGNIELQAGGVGSPGLDLVTAEYQLPHLEEGYFSITNNQELSLSPRSS